MRTANVTLALAALTGLALRAWALTPPLGALDGDEGVWGLMSLHVLEGEWPAFFWAQEYGGSHEVILSAPVVWLLGPEAFAIRVVPIVLFGVAVWLVRQIGRETIGEPGATYAAALVCVWPAYVIWKSTRAHGFYGSGLVLALLTVLLVLKLRDRHSAVLSGALGLVLGLGLWATPQVGLLALPSVAWLVARRPRALRGALYALPLALAGALPWLLWNLEHDWASFDRAVATGAGTYGSRLQGFATALLPTLVGLRVPFSLEWLPGAALGWACVAALVVGLAWLAVRGRARVGVLLLAAGAYPFLFALSPFAWFVEEPRYLVLLAPVLALLAASALGGGPLAPVAVLAAAAVSAAGLARMTNTFVVTADGVPLPDERAPLVRSLDRAGVRHVLADYSLAYIVTFETGERVIGSPLGQPRHGGLAAAVRDDPRRAYATVSGSSRAATWRARPPAARRVVAGGFVLYVPRRR